MTHRYPITVLAALMATLTVGLTAAGMAAASTAAGSGGAATRSPGGPTPAAGADLERPDADELQRVIADVLDERIGEDVAGVAVAVVDGDELVLAEGYGQADIDAGTPVRADDSAFRVGSVGKLVTWTAVMQGVEDGLLDLGADVNGYLGDSPVEVPASDDGGPVTLRHLGTHTPGFDAAANPGMVEDADDLVALEQALVAAVPERLWSPGELVAYSNYGAALAGHVVEQVYGTDFDDRVRQAIFDPLGMDYSTFAQPVPDDHPGQVVTAHTAAGGLATARAPLISWRPAGSMVASATDMAAFMRAHLGGGEVDGARILAADTVATMHERHHVRHPAVTNWRYGFYEHGHPDHGLIGHSGMTLHDTTMLVLAPEHGVGVFAAANTPSMAPMEVVDAVLDAYGIAVIGEPQATTEPGGGQRAAAVAGEYRLTGLPESGPASALGALLRLTVAADDDGIDVSALILPSEDWVETAPYVYEQADGDDVLAFDVADDRVVAAHLASGPAGTLLPVPWAERQPVLGGIMALSLAVFALSLAGWPLAALVRRRRRARAGAAGGQGGAVASGGRGAGWQARAAGVALAGTSWAFVVLLLVSFVVGGQDQMFITEPLPLRIAYLLPYLIAALAVAAALTAVPLWRRRLGTVPVRVHHTGLAVLGLALLWPLHVSGFLLG